MDKHERALIIAEQITPLIQMVDMTAILLKDDIDLLDEAADVLRKKISFNESAAPLITALGGNYNSLEDSYKLKTTKLLAELIKVRNEYRKALEEQEEENKNKEKLLRMFNL